ncbi:MAG TPA: Ig-like domain-containing protein, partial [Longimicrobiales bacterium]|nr:Ig-like domain-containing protein [Longimicrobiales bacterium]
APRSRASLVMSSRALEDTVAGQYRTPPRSVGRKALLTLSGTLLWWASVACPSSTEPGAPDLLNPEPDSLKVTPDSVELEVGQSRLVSVQAFDENNANVTAGASFEWSSAHAQYVEVEPSGQEVRVQGLQEWVDGGTTGWNQVTVRIRGRSAPVGRVYVKVRPVDNIQVTPSPLAIQVGESVSVTADATISTGGPVSVSTTWSLGDGAVASVTAQTGSNTATVTGLAPGTTTLRATAGTKESGPVTLTVAQPGPEPGIIYGVLYDVDGTTALDSVNLTMGLVNAPAGSTTYRTRTGRQAPGPVPAGGYRFETDAGVYAAFTVGVLGSRWVSTPGDTAGVLAGDSTRLDLNVKRGYHLDMLGTTLGSLQASPGSSLDLVVDYRTWCRDGGALCSTALAIGVDAAPLAVYRFGQPGIHPGQSEQGLTVPITVPATGGTIYAMLVTASTADANGGIQAGLDQYASVWAGNLQATMLIPIGTLTVN